MRKIFLILLIFLFFIPQAYGQNKGNRWALTIAIDQYPEAAGAENLIYALKDADDMENMFINYWSVPKENITSLRNDQATLANIKKTITDVVSKVGENDLLFIYIRCQGNDNFPDFNGDERDGSDETIIPYDCQWKYPKTYVIDERFTELLKPIKGKLIIICDVAGGGGFIDLIDNPSVDSKTLLISPGPPGSAALEESSFENSVMAHYIIEENKDIYEEYLDEIKNKSEEAKDLTIDLILEKVKKSYDSYIESKKARGELLVDGKLNQKDIIILKK